MKKFKIMVEVEVLASSDDEAYEIVNDGLCTNKLELIQCSSIKYPHSVDEFTEDEYMNLNEGDKERYFNDLIEDEEETLQTLAIHPWEDIREFARQQLEEAV